MDPALRHGNMDTNFLVDMHDKFEARLQRILDIDHEFRLQKTLQTERAIDKFLNDVQEPYDQSQPQVLLKPFNDEIAIAKDERQQPSAPEEIILIDSDEEPEEFNDDDYDKKSNSDNYDRETAVNYDKSQSDLVDNEAIPSTSPEPYSKIPSGSHDPKPPEKLQREISEEPIQDDYLKDFQDFEISKPLQTSTPERRLSNEHQAINTDNDTPDSPDTSNALSKSDNKPNEKTPERKLTDIKIDISESKFSLNNIRTVLISSPTKVISSLCKLGNIRYPTESNKQKDISQYVQTAHDESRSADDAEISMQGQDVGGDINETDRLVNAHNSENILSNSIGQHIVSTVEEIPLIEEVKSNDAANISLDNLKDQSEFKEIPDSNLHTINSTESGKCSNMIQGENVDHASSPIKFEVSSPEKRTESTENIVNLTAEEPENRLDPEPMLNTQQRLDAPLKDFADSDLSEPEANLSRRLIEQYYTEPSLDIGGSSNRTNNLNEDYITSSDTYSDSEKSEKEDLKPSNPKVVIKVRQKNSSPNAEPKLSLVVKNSKSVNQTNSVNDEKLKVSAKQEHNSNTHQRGAATRSKRRKRRQNEDTDETFKTTDSHSQMARRSRKN